MIGRPFFLRRDRGTFLVTEQQIAALMEAMKCWPVQVGEPSTSPTGAKPFLQREFIMVRSYRSKSCLHNAQSCIDTGAHWEYSRILASKARGL